jgi:hypothetical protein
MAEINGYLLTKEEEKACADLVKKLRERKTFSIDFSGYIQVKAKSHEEANEIFWNWVGDLQDKTLVDWSGTIKQSPYFENEGIEEE